MNNYFHSEVFYEPRTCEAKECLGPLAEKRVYYFLNKVSYVPMLQFLLEKAFIIL